MSSMCRSHISSFGEDRTYKQSQEQSQAAFQYGCLATGGSDEEEADDKDNVSEAQQSEQQGKAQDAGDTEATPEPDDGKSEGHQEHASTEQQEAQPRRDLDAEYDAKLAEVPLRSEPIGMDRYYRRYWALKGKLGVFSFGIQVPDHLQICGASVM